MLDEEDVRLADVLREPKQRIQYEYDFGDGWVHEIMLEKILPREKQELLPVCVKGKRACPPEDCGGVWGYEALLKVLSDPKHEQYEDMQEWVGDDDFDPEAFCPDSANQRLAAYRQSAE